MKYLLQFINIKYPHHPGIFTYASWSYEASSVYSTVENNLTSFIYENNYFSFIFQILNNIIIFSSPFTSVLWTLGSCWRFLTSWVNRNCLQGFDPWWPTRIIWCHWRSLKKQQLDRTGCGAVQHKSLQPTGGELSPEEAQVPVPGWWQNWGWCPGLLINHWGVSRGSRSWAGLRSLEFKVTLQLPEWKRPITDEQVSPLGLGLKSNLRWWRVVIFERQCLWCALYNFLAVGFLSVTI